MVQNFLFMMLTPFMLRAHVEMRKGVVKVPEGIGLGVEMNEEAIDEFFVK